MKKFDLKLGALGLIFLVSLSAMAAKIGDDTLRVGAKTGADIDIQMGSGRVKWDNTASKMQFSNDGVSFKDIGSGGGAGGGENFNNGFGADDNANAEDGITGWSNTGGAFAFTAVDPLESIQSFTYTAAAQNDFVEGPVLSFDKDIFKGRACQAQIEYVGGDENLTLKVIDGNALVLGSLVLPAHGISAPESLFFLCPSAADIGGDAQKGNLKIRIENVGASAAPLIKFDKSYLGTNSGLSESVLPDTLTARLDSTAGVLDGGAWIQSSSFVSTGRLEVVPNPGVFTVVPTCVCTADTGNTFNCGTDKNTSTVSLLKFSTTNPAAAGALASSRVQIVCTKQGADAKQSVQVYKSIPKAAENFNEFSAKIQNNGAVSVISQSTSFITSAVFNSTGKSTVTLSSNVFTVAPSVTATVTSADLSIASIVKISDFVYEVYTPNHAGTLQDRDYDLHVAKQTVDVKTPTVQPIIVGQVTNKYAESASKNVRIEGCYVLNNGTATTDSASGLCGWIVALSRTALGHVLFTIDTGIFSKDPVCTCTNVGSNSGKHCEMFVNSNTSFDTFTTDSSLVVADRAMMIQCIGAR